VRRSSLGTAAVGLVASLAVSVAAYWLLDTLFVFLVVPFAPFLFRPSTDRAVERVCDTCGYRTRSSAVAYCPRDGTELERRE
jgi:uncharacterized paraquat-inducible protein A